MINRRQFLGTLAGAAAMLGIPGATLAQANTERRFIFVFAAGGWDPLCVFAPLFGSRAVDMETEAEPMTIGGFNLVDHPGRPSVRRFFETHGNRTVVFNGISTRSIAHDVCTFVAMTGSSSGSESDWPSIIGHDALGRYNMPSLVLDGPTLPGNLEVAVARGGNGLLGPLINGDIVYYGEDSQGGPEGRAGTLIDRFVARRTERIQNELKTAHARGLAKDLDTSLRQGVHLKRDQGALPFERAYDFRGRLQMAVAALSQGLSRTVTLTDDGFWDTHEDNSPQTELFENLFGGLDELMLALATTNGPEGNPLSQDTVVVVLSEMGRTPKFNFTDGRDHWPYTSAMIIGQDIAGGREIGAYNSEFSGIGVDADSGELMPEALGVSAEDFGATVLTLADVDPGPILPNAKPIGGILQ